MKKFLGIVLVLVTVLIYPTEKSGTQIPIVYHPQYNITFLGFEKLHPFDSAKYGKVMDYLVNRGILTPSQAVQPKEVTEEELLKVHSEEYLKSLRENSSRMLAEIAEISLLYHLPNYAIRKWALHPMRLATGGTVEAAQLALNHGWSINLSGGYHHAKEKSGEGFCVYADIPLAARILLEQNKVKKILVIDLDAHQGNGLESIFGTHEYFKDKAAVDVFDVYNGRVYPNDVGAKKYIQYKHELRGRADDSTYLALLKTHLSNAVDTSQPDLIIYNAGTDILAGDKLGQMAVTKQGIVSRDEYVFKTALSKEIPIMMVLSGGYTSESAPIIGKSIENIITNIIPTHRNVTQVPLNVSQKK